MTIVASCGHELRPEDRHGFAIRYHSETCDPVDGFLPSITYATFCRKCASEAVLWPEFIAVINEEEWMREYDEEKKKPAEAGSEE